MDADNIYVMKDGKIVENGNHDELIDIKCEYFYMVNKHNQLESKSEVC